MTAMTAATLSALTVQEAEQFRKAEGAQGATILNLTFDQGDRPAFPISSAPEASLAAGQGVNGTTALKITRSNTTDYKLNSMSLGIIPKGDYELQFMARGENLSPAPNNYSEFAAVELNQGGRWLRGSYYRLSKGEKIPEQWTLIKVPFRIQDNDNKVSISFFIARNTTGTIYIDDARITTKETIGTVVPIEPKAMTIFGNSGLVSFKAPQECTDDSMLLVELAAQKQVISMDSNRIFKTTFGNLAVGEYTLSATLLSPQKKLKGNAISIPLFVKAPEKAPRNAVTLDKYGRTIVDGRPFFPMGIYAYTDKDELDAVTTAGFNCIACYSTIHGKDENGKHGVKGIKMTMDDIWARNLKVIFSVKDQILKSPITEMDGVKGNLAVTEHVVRNLKDHPALLSWYITDELPLSEIGKAVELRAAVAKNDPWHPAYSITYRKNDMPDYAISGDITGMDPYPIQHLPGHYEISVVSVESDLCALSGQPYWIIPQMFSWARYRMKTADDFVNKGRFPTQDEMIAMPLLAVLHGARGLIFYSAYDMLGRSEKLAKGSSKAQWDRAIETLRVLNPLQEYFLWIEHPKPLAIQSTVGNQLEGKIFKSESGRTAVIIVGSNKAAKGTFEVPGFPNLRSVLGRTQNLGNSKYEITVDGVQADVLVE